MEQATELLEHLKGWRRRVVYVDGQKVTWESTFSFAWCYEKKKASFKPEYYCFGYENEYQLNPWGCIQSGLFFTDNAEWFCWGRWLSNRGDWEFDKPHIQHELEKNLYTFRFCPTLDLRRVSDVLRVFPDRVNPNQDKNWKFVERWGDETIPGLTVVVNRYGFQEKVIMKGVSPNGPGVLKGIAQKLNLRLIPSQ